jgi:hypothetical protein
MVAAEHSLHTVGAEYAMCESGLIEPLELGTPGAYVASGEPSPQSLEEGCLGEGDMKSGTSERDDRVMAVRKGNTAKYCVLKVLNTRGQYL